jgi:hypothetical protein
MAGGRASKSIQHSADVFHFGRRSKAVAHQCAPFGKIFGAAKIHGMVFRSIG